jgi:hypothetical protein
VKGISQRSLNHLKIHDSICIDIKFSIEIKTVKEVNDNGWSSFIAGEMNLIFN